MGLGKRVKNQNNERSPQGPTVSSGEIWANAPVATGWLRTDGPSDGVRAF